MEDERVRLGDVGVDSGQLLVIDPCYLEDWDHQRSYPEACHVTGDGTGGQFHYASGRPGLGVAFRSGFGDGVYLVWATVRDFGPWRRRVVRVEIDLLGNEEDEDL